VTNKHDIDVRRLHGGESPLCYITRHYMDVNRYLHVHGTVRRR